ncbi:helix-turn-helix transcriptional regulator [Arthrobacter sp. SX1312]|uniref:ArsR/SmtB family transcription factor n=1 Tax=Arthrobacter sp. SX1312 TaxID=2058896 RepID=UPI002156F79D|nr:metalloregulator ArsR/SmtB family transcription factor [Arthrobacter sp. SX1312]
MTMNYDVHQHDEVALIFRALAEPARLSLVHCLADGPHRVGELSGHLGLAQSTVSAHLAVLKNAGLVSATPEGRATLYQLAHPGLDELLHAGERLLLHSRSEDPADDQSLPLERQVGAAHAAHTPGGDINPTHPASPPPASVPGSGVALTRVSS